jgi:hypothetical protein
MSQSVPAGGERAEGQDRLACRSHSLWCRKEPGSSDEKDREGELVALDYDADTSKGERAVKVRRSLHHQSLSSTGHPAGRLGGWQV